MLDFPDSRSSIPNGTPIKTSASEWEKNHLCQLLSSKLSIFDTFTCNLLLSEHVMSNHKFPIDWNIHSSNVTFSTPPYLYIYCEAHMHDGR